jgi:ubiquinol-cytochrome c reductase cytochrome c1 subunit
MAWDKFPKERTTDMAALQNGAKLFANYCLNCHSAPSCATTGCATSA